MTWLRERPLCHRLDTPGALGRSGGSGGTTGATRSVSLGERLPQSHERTVRAALGGGGGDTEEVGDLVEPELGLPAEVEDLPVTVAELRQRLLHEQAVGRPVLGGSGAGLAEYTAERPILQLLGAQPVEPAALGDPVEPGGQRCAVAQLGASCPGARTFPGSGRHGGKAAHRGGASRLAGAPHARRRDQRRGCRRERFGTGIALAERARRDQGVPAVAVSGGRRGAAVAVSGGGRGAVVPAGRRGAGSRATGGRGAGRD